MTLTKTLFAIGLISAANLSFNIIKFYPRIESSSTSLPPLPPDVSPPTLNSIHPGRLKAVQGEVELLKEDIKILMNKNEHIEELMEKHYSADGSAASAPNSLDIVHNSTKLETLEETDVPGNKEETEDNVDGSAFCLIIKDDNDIISEWIAYHYHVFNMRRLIVAVDPNSKTSPLEVLEPWSRASGNFELDFTLWNDEDYTPKHFHSKEVDTEYSKMPYLLLNQVTLVDGSHLRTAEDIINKPISHTNWHGNTTWVKEHQEEVSRDVLGINDYLFRQVSFIGECFRQVKREQEASASSPNSKGAISWAVDIDTDEFLVPNPYIALRDEDHLDDIERNSLRAMLPETPSAGSLFSFFNRFLAHGSVRRGCIMMPRILYGAKEDDEREEPGKTNTWNHKQFETLRWEYHADYKTFRHRPKAMVDVSQLQLLLGENDENQDELRYAFAMHRPFGSRLINGSKGCSSEPWSIYNTNSLVQPLAAHHYLGSLERFMSRGDVRRNAGIHEGQNLNSNYAKGDENSDSNTEGEGNNDGRRWIEGWLDSFVETHGSEQVLTVLDR